MEIKIFSDNTEKQKKIIGLIHKVYLAQQKTNRKYTASTKTRAEVRGGGKKPWRQKGTGNARAGSNSSPLWEGGGVIFGPKPRIVNKKINKKEKRLAILASLYLKQKEFVLIEKNLTEMFSEVKTKNVLNLLKTLNVSLEARTLFILTKPNRNIWLATRNLKNVEVVVFNCLNVNQLLNVNKIILSNESLQLINLAYGKSYA